MAQFDYLLAGDPIHAVVAGAGPNLPLADDEKVTGVCCIHEPVNIQHQTLVGAGFFRGNTRENTV